MDKPSKDQITALLVRWSNGDEHALDEVIPLVYDRLRAMAKFQLFKERAGHTLQPTALVHEVYIKLAKGKTPVWNDRAHFLAVAARAMRQVLVDDARKRNRDKGPGKYEIVPLDEALIVKKDRSGYLVALDDALDVLARTDLRKARVVELKIFGGLTNGEIASVLKVSENTVMNDYRMGLARLMVLLRKGADDRGTKKED